MEAIEILTWSRMAPLFTFHASLAWAPLPLTPHLLQSTFWDMLDGPGKVAAALRGRQPGGLGW